MPGLEDRELPTIPKSNDSLGGESGLEKLIRPFYLFKFLSTYKFLSTHISKIK